MGQVVLYLVHMNSRRYLLSLPTWALMAATFLAALAPVVTANTQASDDPNFLAERQAIVQAEIAREADGQPCVDPATLKPGQFPSRVLVSTVNVDHASTAVESYTFDRAMAEAKAGRVTVRCAIA